MTKLAEVIGRIIGESAHAGAGLGDMPSDEECRRWILESLGLSPDDADALTTDELSCVVTAEDYARAEPILRFTHKGIVGLGPGPYVREDETFSWPTEGYDSQLIAPGCPDERGLIRSSGYSREEWLALSNVMLARWKDFRRAIERAPADG